jgi:hypothetical protein
MKYRNHLGAFCCVFCLFGSLAGPTGYETKKEQSVTASLANARSDRVEKVVIYYIPERFMPVRAIDEASLEGAFHRSVTLRNFGSARIREGVTRDSKRRIHDCNRIRFSRLSMGLHFLWPEKSASCVPLSNQRWFGTNQ